jgi:plastocyanin
VNPPDRADVARNVGPVLTAHGHPRESIMRRLAATITAGAAALGLAGVGIGVVNAAQGDDTGSVQHHSSDTSRGKITGSVGPGMTISVSRHNVAHGRYTFTVTDKSTLHNWHIFGPGVNRKTPISKKVTKTFTVQLVKGTYKIHCDVHPTTMKTHITVS